MRSGGAEGGPTVIGAQPSAASQWEARASRGRGRSLILRSVTCRHHCSCSVDAACPGLTSEVPPGIRAGAAGPGLGWVPGAPGHGGSGGWRGRLRSRVWREPAEGACWALTGRQAPPPQQVCAAGGGHWGIAGRRAASPHAIRAGRGAAHPGREQRAREARRERLWMWHLRLPERAEPGRPLGARPMGAGALLSRPAVHEPVPRPQGPRGFCALTLSLSGASGFPGRKPLGRRRVGPGLWAPRARCVPDVGQESAFWTRGTAQ